MLPTIPDPATVAAPAAMNLSDWLLGTKKLSRLVRLDAEIASAREKVAAQSVEREQVAQEAHNTVRNLRASPVMQHISELQRMIRRR